MEALPLALSPSHQCRAGWLFVSDNCIQVYALAHFRSGFRSKYTTIS